MAKINICKLGLSLQKTAKNVRLAAILTESNPDVRNRKRNEKSSLLNRKKHTDGEIHEKIIVIRCFETKQSSSIIYKSKQRVKCLIQNFLSHLRSHLQTKSLKVIHSHAHQYTEIRVFTTDHIVYTLYIYSILLVVKDFKNEEKNYKVIVKTKKNMYFQPILLFECYCFQPSSHTNTKNTLFKLKNPLFHNFLTVVCPKKKRKPKYLSA